MEGEKYHRTRGLPLNRLEHKAHEERAAREGPPLSPVGNPCLLAHMAFLPRREGGEAMMLLNKSSKRAARGPVRSTLESLIASFDS